MGAVKALIGELPTTPPVVDEAMIRGLRAPSGAAPCEEGLEAALRWLKGRVLPFAEALEEARRHPAVAPHLRWGLEALGLSGTGDGYGTGDGSGDGDGTGYGYGSGDGYGTGDGDGTSYGTGDGSGDGTGTGYGYGYGYGSGYGDGDGTGSGSGDGYD